MRLTTAQAKKVEDTFGVKTISEDHPVYSRLKEAFGDHTFVLDSEGLNIVEPDPVAENSNGKVVRLASWTEDRNSLSVHEPQVLPVNVDLDTDE